MLLGCVPQTLCFSTFLLSGRLSGHLSGRLSGHSSDADERVPYQGRPLPHTQGPKNAQK